MEILDSCAGRGGRYGTCPSHWRDVNTYVLRLVFPGVVSLSFEVKARTPPSCRVHMKVEGLEWFIYNRTAAYDAIISAIDPSMPQVPESARPSGDGRSSLRKIFSATSAAPPPPECEFQGSVTSIAIYNDAVIQLHCLDIQCQYCLRYMLVRRTSSSVPLPGWYLNYQISTRRTYCLSASRLLLERSH